MQVRIAKFQLKLPNKRHQIQIELRTRMEKLNNILGLRHFCQARGSTAGKSLLRHGQWKAGWNITLTSNRLVTLTHDWPLPTLTIWSQVSHTSRLSTGRPWDHDITPRREKNDECDQCNITTTWSQVSHTNTLPTRCGLWLSECPNDIHGSRTNGFTKPRFITKSWYQIIFSLVPCRLSRT